jgi:hypothetical protein
MGDTASRGPVRHNRPALLEDQRRQIIGLVTAFLGLALLFSPWVMGDSPTSGMEGHRNELGMGLIVVFAAAVRFSGRAGKWSDPVFFAAGLWLLLSPWLLGLQSTYLTEGSRILDRAAGTVLILLALASRLMAALVVRRDRRAEQEWRDERAREKAAAPGPVPR